MNKNGILQFPNYTDYNTDQVRAEWELQSISEILGTLSHLLI